MSGAVAERPGNTLVTRVVAVDRVSRCVSPAVRGALFWFYGELLGLPEVVQEGNGDAADEELRFRSESIELRFVVGEPSAPDPGGKVTLDVNSLEEAARRFDEHGVAYERTHGFSLTEERIRTRDPAHHAVILQQTWPF